MKKLLSALLMLTLVFSLAACGEDEVELGEYKPGLHLGYTEGNKNTFAYVYVDSKGFIADIHIDMLHAKSDAEGPLWDVDDDSAKYIATTKRSLDDGNEYNMNSEEGSSEAKEDGLLLWVEQVDALADDIVEAQAIPEYSITADGKFDDDAISGVSIAVTPFITAIENALGRAELGSDEVPTDFNVPEFDREGEYTPGIQYGYSEGSSNGHAFLAVNEEGNIEYAAIDVVYFHTTDTDAAYTTMNYGSEVNGIIITKMTLDYGNEYNMNSEEGSSEAKEDGLLLWVEQMQAVADDVVANQGLENYSIVDGKYETPDDAVAGVSITVDHVIAAIEMALDR
jgi:hypothetical protein